MNAPRKELGWPAAATLIAAMVGAAATTIALAVSPPSDSSRSNRYATAREIGEVKASLEAIEKIEPPNASRASWRYSRAARTDSASVEAAPKLKMSSHLEERENLKVRIRDRIKELRRVRAGDLTPNSKNWRTHPEAQRNALRGVLADIGYADALLVRELPGGSMELIDGHLRAETTPDAMVPVLVLDVNEEEAHKILLTHDPLAAMAMADEKQVQDLIQSCEFEHPQIVEMLDQLEQEVAQAAKKWMDPIDRPEAEIPELFQVVVECDNEKEQQTMYQRMRKEGYRCRVLTL